MKSKMFVLALVGAFLFGMTAYAHHSFGGTYELKKEIKIEGKLVQFLFRNPHSFVHVEVKDESGTPQRWAVEWAGGGQLDGAGITRTTLHVGDPVEITGNPSRAAGEHKLRMVSFKRTSDGLGWGGGRPGQVVD